MQQPAWGARFGRNQLNQLTGEHGRHKITQTQGDAQGEFSVFKSEWTLFFSRQTPPIRYDILPWSSVEGAAPMTEPL